MLITINRLTNISLSMSLLKKLLKSIGLNKTLFELCVPVMLLLMSNCLCEVGYESLKYLPQTLK